MKEIVNFLFQANKLKETQRTGWIIWRVKKPESIAEHIFRVAFLSYLLGWKKKLRAKTIIQTAASHDLCEVYAGDATPLFYYQNLDIKKKKHREILLKGIRLSSDEKKKMSKIKFGNEKKSLLKLLAPLEKNLRGEIFLRWLDYEKGFSREGKLVRQIDWIENLIQSLEYLGPKRSGSGWWEIAAEKVYDPFLLDFLKIIKLKFYNPKLYKKTSEMKDLQGILEFALTIGKLKRLKRSYWKGWGIKNAESVAEHIFTVTLLAWIFSSKRKNLDQGKLLKMALCHEISAAIIGDTIPYIDRLPLATKERKEILKKWPRLPEDKKAEKFLKQYKSEKKAMEKLAEKLEKNLKEEIVELWSDYRTIKSPEAVFLNQVNVLSILLQGVLYQKKYKISVIPLFEWSLEKCDDAEILEFITVLSSFSKTK